MLWMASPWAAAVLPELTSAAAGQPASPSNLAAADDHPGTGRWVHGFAAYGLPKYGSDFAHFDYVEPRAPVGGTLKLRNPDRRSSFDKYNPWTTRGNAPAGVLIWMVEGLCHLSMDEKMSVYGLLAEAPWVEPDFSAVSFRLRPEARFSNGDPVLSADVRHSYEMLASKGASPDVQQAVADIARVLTPDAHTVRFEFKTRARDTVFTAATMPVFSRKWTAGRPFDQVVSEYPITTGPCVIDRVDMPRRIEFKRLPDYWGRNLPVRRGHFNFERIVYRNYTDNAVAFEAFKAGEFDFYKEYGARSWVRRHKGVKWDDGRITKLELDTGFGQQIQSYQFAMALACRPRLLICDEPTTALDVTIQAQILALLDELQAEIGMALLFITHDLNLVRRFTHRVGVMERGKLVEMGATAKVFADPQHPYTRRLLASGPQRVVQSLPSDAPVLVEGQHVEVQFVITKGWFGSLQFKAVKDATLQLRRGETLGVVGESGSGKTTLGMALLALQSISAGQIKLDGERIDNASRDSLRRMRKRMQVVFQDPFASLSPRMTIGQIVGEGLALHQPQLNAASRTERVLQMLAEVGLSERQGIVGVLQRYPHEFSGGQRQRIAIARAVVLQPEVLVLDEPTSALDVSVQQQVLALLADLQKRYGMSYLFISHDLAVVRAMSHRVIVMKNGEMVEQGEAQALFDAPQQPYTQALLAAAHLAG